MRIVLTGSFQIRLDCSYWRDPYHVVSDYWVAHSEIDLLIVHHTDSCQIGEIGADCCSWLIFDLVGEELFGERIDLQIDVEFVEGQYGIGYLGAGG
jgi:hypothetical protein